MLEMFQNGSIQYFELFLGLNLTALMALLNLYVSFLLIRWVKGLKFACEIVVRDIFPVLRTFFIKLM